MNEYASLWEVELMETYFHPTTTTLCLIKYASLWEVELMETSTRQSSQPLRETYASLWEVELMETIFTGLIWGT